MFQDELRKDAQARQAQAGYPVDIDRGPQQDAIPLVGRVGAVLKTATQAGPAAGSMTDEYNKAMDSLRFNGECRQELGQAIAELYRLLREARYLVHDPANIPPNPVDKNMTEEPPPNGGVGTQFRGLRNLAVASNSELIEMTGFVRRLTQAIDQ